MEMESKRIAELTRQVAHLLAENQATKLDADRIFSGLDGYLVISCREENAPAPAEEPAAVTERGQARMRTAVGVIAELKAADPDTEVTTSYIRRLIKSGHVPVVEVGCKKLVNMDDVMAHLSGAAK